MDDIKGVTRRIRRRMKKELTVTGLNSLHIYVILNITNSLKSTPPCSFYNNIGIINALSLRITRT